MKLTDFLEDSGLPEDKETEQLSLVEMEKTAELLESMSKEDTVMDGIAKLAVLLEVTAKQEAKNKNLADK